MKRATVSFTEKDLERLEDLKNAFEFQSNAQTISMALKIADEIRKQKKAGGKVLINQDGKEINMLIPGLE